MEHKNEHSVVFTTEEVKATLDNLKTQHRMRCLTDEQVQAGFSFDFSAEGDAAIFLKVVDDEVIDDLLVDCPFGKDGDRLWVQEEWRIGAWNHDTQRFAIDYKASPELTNTPWLRTSEDDLVNQECFYKFWSETVDELNKKGFKTYEDGHYYWPAGQAPLEWRSAASMPRWASRILLETTDIHIERVQDITVVNAQAEGSQLQISTTYNESSFHKACGEIMEWFKSYWNAKHSELNNYVSNPWVWVDEFKKIEPSNETDLDPHVDELAEAPLTEHIKQANYSEIQHRYAMKISGKRIW